jgi:biopolymer transport protein ExbD
VQQQVAGVRHENGELQRRLSMIEQLRSDAATLPTLQRSAAETNAATERRSVVVTITAEGTIRWGDRTLTLARFVHELKQLNASARDGATLVIRSDGASFDAFSYAVDEARLHGISHVVVERTGPVDSHSRFNWF